MFRVFDLKKKQFIKGEYFISMDGDLVKVTGDLIKKLKMLPESRYIFQRDIGNRDKYGIKIFEGDVLRSSTGLTGIVTYLHKRAAYVLLEFKEQKWYDLGDEICVQLEVIGNNFTMPDSYIMNVADGGNEN